MLDITLRPLKDNLFDPLCKHIPHTVSPLHITTAAFIAGLAACSSAAAGFRATSLALWITNRALDCMDGAVARQRGQASDLGGFLDLLGDFVIYSLIPIACGITDEAGKHEVYHMWLAVSIVEASFHINNFVLFFVAAVAEKRIAAGADNELDRGKATKELTSVMMRPALIEGTESAVLFTLMLFRSAWTEMLCWTMAVLVGVGTCQRVVWVTRALR